MKHVTQEDLELDRRVTRLEAVIDHKKEKIDFVDRNTKFPHGRFIALYTATIALGVGLFVWQVNVFQNLGEENPQQFGEVTQQMVELRTVIDETNELLDITNKLFYGSNEHIAKTNEHIARTNELLDGSNELPDNTNELLNRTNKYIDRTNEYINRTNELLDGKNERLAVVENVLTINHQPSGYYQTGKL